MPLGTGLWPAVSYGIQYRVPNEHVTLLMMIYALRVVRTTSIPCRSTLQGPNWVQNSNQWELLEFYVNSMQRIIAESWMLYVVCMHIHMRTL